MNRALQGLADIGLLERRRKAGTRVALDPVRKATLEIPVTRLEVEATGGRYDFVVLERRKLKPPRALTMLMGLADGADTRMLHVRGLHRADGVPFLYEDRWVNLAAVPDIAAVDFSEISPNEWLVRNQPFTRGDISFSAANADAAEAAALECETGTALFLIERVTWNESAPVTAVRLAYRPGYRMTTTI